MTRSLNIVVAGKSGAGKSSLLNYIADKELFKTGIGSPVTQDYFNLHKHSHPTKDVIYNLYDTKGIEPNTIKEFEENVIGKIDEFSNSEDFFEHIHTLYYCIASSSKRIETFEINFIKNISKKVDVVIVLTKSDLVSEDDNTEFKEVLKNEVGASENQIDTQIRVIEVCSVQITTRKGTSFPYGKESVLNHSLLGLWDVFAKHISQKIYDVVYKTSIRTTFNVNNISVSKEFENIKKTIFLENWKEDSIIEDPFNNFIFFDAISSERLESLKRTDLSSFDKSVMKEFLNSSLRIYNQIPTLICYLEELKVLAKNEIKTIIEFYSQLTLNSISIPVPLQLSNRKIDELKQFFNEDMFDEWKSLVKLLLEVLHKDNSSDWWSSFLLDTQKVEFNFCFNEYIEFCSFIHEKIMKLLNEHKNIFQTELISYGKLIISPLKDNEGEKIFADEVRFAFEGGNIIDTSAKRFLDRVRFKNNISEERANEIIDQIKYEMNIS